MVNPKADLVVGTSNVLQAKVVYVGTVVQNILLTNAKLLARSVMVVENPITISLCADLKIALSLNTRGIVPLNRTMLSKINKDNQDETSMKWTMYHRMNLISSMSKTLSQLCSIHKWEARMLCLMKSHHIQISSVLSQTYMCLNLDPTQMEKHSLQSWHWCMQQFVTSQPLQTDCRKQGKG